MAFSNASNRILYDVPCAVCRDHSSGKHYGVFACDGCAGFFKRSVRRDRQYSCKARTIGRCLVDKAHRNQCRACRLAKCLDVGMNRDAVQHERGPRNSTIRRQMAMYFRDRPSPANRRAIPPPPPVNQLNIIQQNPLAPLPPYVFPTSFYNRLLHSPPIIFEPSIVPTPMVLQSEADALCETAARLLFMNVKWVKSLPAFTSLSLSDRLLLLEESWRELFVLAAAQMAYPINLRLLYNPTMGHAVLTGMEIFENTLEEIARVRPDTNEFTNLRALIIFKTRIEGRPVGHVPIPGMGNKLQDVATIAAMQDSARIALNEYASQTYPIEQARIGQLFQLLHFIRQVPSMTIVELFFKATIGEIEIEKIICDMYTSEKTIV